MNKNKLGLAALGLAGAFAVGYVVKKVVDGIRNNPGNDVDDSDECNYEIISAETESSDVDSDEE